MALSTITVFHTVPNSPNYPTLNFSANVLSGIFQVRRRVNLGRVARLHLRSW